MLVKIGNKEFSVDAILPIRYEWSRINGAMERVPRHYYAVTCPVCHKTKEIRRDKLLQGIGNVHLICARSSIYSETRTKEILAKRLMSSYITAQASRKKIVKFKLSLQDVIELIFNNCFYCGCTPNQRRNNYNLLFHGIDRIDSNKDYIVGNCVACCFKCNRAKSDMSIKEFEEWIDTIAKYRGYERNGEVWRK